MQMGIIGDVMGEKITTVQPFIMKSVKTDPSESTAKPGQQGRIP